MSAIAALCALSCAVAPLSAAQPVGHSPDQTIQAAQHIPAEIEQVAQLPTLEESQPLDLPTEPPYSEVQIQDRNGEQQQFSLETEPPPPEPTATTEIPIPSVLEVLSDRQEYNEQTEVVTALGNVVVRFQAGVLTADQLQINLNSKLAIAKGNVALQRGQQILRGEQFHYFFVQNRGSIEQAQGEVSQASFQQDFSQPPAPTFSNQANPAVLLNERLLLQQPITAVSGVDGVNLLVGSGRDIGTRAVPEQGGTINRVRFQAGSIEFVGDRWEAKDVYLTNDPFSPPELQIYAQSATYQPVNEFVDELVTTKTRILIDDNISLPLFPRTFRFGTSEGIFSEVSAGFDDEERGGLFIQRRFSIFQSRQGQWTVTPQYLVQKAFFPDTPIGETTEDDAGKVLAPGVFALTSKFNYTFNPRLLVQAKGSLENLRLEDIDEKLKLNFRVEQLFGKLDNPFRFSQEFNFRDRLFNGSLGFQRVQRSMGVVLRSPDYRFGDSGFSTNYQASIQNIDANTDRPALLDPGVSEGEVNLTRLQGTVALSHNLTIWQGQALPATRFAGLRYSPQPIVPYLALATGIRGVTAAYSNGDRQASISGSIGIQGQLGHFSRNSFDYTGFNLTYSRGTRGETSPFLFDRFADRQTLELGLTQHLYGPFRVGFQTLINLDRDEPISTDYFMEYSRRTHAVLLRYNPVLEIGSLSIKINDFNWNGTTDPFVTQEIRPVIEGVIP